MIGSGRSRRRLWDVACVALLRALAGESCTVIARRKGMTRAVATRCAELHRIAMATDVGYRRLMHELARRVLLEESESQTSLPQDVRVSIEALSRSRAAGA
jgi:hypothetical protein